MWFGNLRRELEATQKQLDECKTELDKQQAENRELAKLFEESKAALAVVAAESKNARESAHFALQKLQAELDDTKKPNFAFNITQRLTAVNNLGQINAQTIVMLHCQIVNRGAPSAVIAWTAQYRKDLHTVNLGVTQPITPFQLPLPGGGSLTIDGKETLNQKGTVPIPKGGVIEGRIMILMPGDQRAELESGTGAIVVTITDYLGEKYEAEFKAVHSANATLSYAPGDKQVTQSPPVIVHKANSGVN